MTDGLPVYAEYKDSGVEWLGEIPAHWDVYPHRTLFTEVIERGYPDEKMLSVTIAQGVIRQAQLLVNSSKKDSSNTDKSKYKLVSEGDIAYNKMRAWQGAIGVSTYRGIISPAYIVVRLREKHNPQYFHYLFRTPAFATEAERWSYGITSDQWSLRYSEFKQIYSPLPPPDEQTAIVAFLDAAEKRIRRYIRAKQKLIKLLNEQKQAIIQQAVTRGLNPDVPMKDSGVEWLGEIPAHWETFAIKHVFQSMDYGISEASTDVGIIRVLTMGNIKDGEITSPELGGVMSVDKYLLLKSNDLLFNRTNSAELVGKVGLFRGYDFPVTFASYLVRLRCNQRSDPEYMNYLLNSVPVLSIARSLAIPSLHQSNLNPTRYGRIVLCFPPHDEQVHIVEFLTQELQPIEVAVKRVHDNLSIIREYQTRLIADVVTGKVDVRGVAFEMPEDFEDVDLLDVDADGVSEDEGEFEDVADDE